MVSLGGGGDPGGPCSNLLRDNLMIGFPFFKYIIPMTQNVTRGIKGKKASKV